MANIFFQIFYVHLSSRETIKYWSYPGGFTGPLKKNLPLFSFKTVCRARTAEWLGDDDGDCVFIPTFLFLHYSFC